MAAEPGCLKIPCVLAVFHLVGAGAALSRARESAEPPAWAGGLVVHCGEGDVHKFGADIDIELGEEARQAVGTCIEE